MKPPRVRLPSPHETPGTNARAVVVGGTIGAVLIIGLVTYLAYPRAEVEAGESTPVQTASAATEPTSPKPVEPTDFLGRAKTRALRWNHEAQLVTIEAGPVVAGRVLPSPRSIRYTFASPGAKLGPGARVGDERLVVHIAKGGKIEAEQAREAAAVTQVARGVADPGCTVEQAWRAAVASGVPSSAEATMTYEHNDRYERAVWRTEVTGDPKHNRTLDGRRCTILTR